MEENVQIVGIHQGPGPLIQPGVVEVLIVDDQSLASADREQSSIHSKQ